MAFLILAIAEKHLGTLISNNRSHFFFNEADEHAADMVHTLFCEITPFTSFETSANAGLATLGAE